MASPNEMPSVGRRLLGNSPLPSKSPLDDSPGSALVVVRVSGEHNSLSAEADELVQADFLSRDERRAAEESATLTRRAQRLYGPALLRALAVETFGFRPGSVRVDREHGRPYLRVEGSRSIFASLSHRESVLVAAVSSTSIGVDFEQPASRTIAHEVRHEFCDEVELVSTQESSDPKTEALISWLHKEAYLKAVGVGLSVDPRSIEFVPVRGPADECSGDVALRRRRTLVRPLPDDARSWTFGTANLDGTGMFVVAQEQPVHGIKCHSSNRENFAGFGWRAVSFICEGSSPPSGCEEHAEGGS